MHKRDTTKLYNMVAVDYLLSTIQSPVCGSFTPRTRPWTALSQHLQVRAKQSRSESLQPPLPPFHQVATQALPTWRFAGWEQEKKGGGGGCCRLRLILHVSSMFNQFCASPSLQHNPCLSCFLFTTCQYSKATLLTIQVLFTL